MSTDQNIGQMIEAKCMKHPCVTPADIEVNISDCVYFTAADGFLKTLMGCDVDDNDSERIDRLLKSGSPLRLLTFCVLVLKNGFTVTGESACVSPENFDAEIGRAVARRNAIDKIWPLMGYALKQKLHDDAKASEDHY